MKTCAKCGKIAGFADRGVELQAKLPGQTGFQPVCVDCYSALWLERMARDGEATLSVVLGMLPRDKEIGLMAPTTAVSLKDWLGITTFPIVFAKGGQQPVPVAGETLFVPRTTFWFIGPDNMIWWGFQAGYAHNKAHCRRTKRPAADLPKFIEEVKREYERERDAAPKAKRERKPKPKKDKHVLPGQIPMFAGMAEVPA